MLVLQILYFICIADGPYEKRRSIPVGNERSLSTGSPAALPFLAGVISSCGKMVQCTEMPDALPWWPQGGLWLFIPFLQEYTAYNILKGDSTFVAAEPHENISLHDGVTESRNAIEEEQPVDIYNVIESLKFWKQIIPPLSTTAVIP